jgi:hypothetical protein
MMARRVRGPVSRDIRKLEYGDQCSHRVSSLPSYDSRRRPQQLPLNPYRSAYTVAHTGFRMGSISAPAPLPRSYDDRAVLQLNPLCDAFFARKLEQRRLDKAQERIWIASIARDVQSNEHTVRSCRVSFPPSAQTWGGGTFRFLRRPVSPNVGSGQSPHPENEIF